MATVTLAFLFELDGERFLQMLPSLCEFYLQPCYRVYGLLAATVLYSTSDRDSSIPA